MPGKVIHNKIMTVRPGLWTGNMNKNIENNRHTTGPSPWQLRKISIDPENALRMKETTLFMSDRVVSYIPSQWLFSWPLVSPIIQKHACFSWRLTFTLCVLEISTSRRLLHCYSGQQVRWWMDGQFTFLVTAEKKESSQSTKSHIMD